MQKKNSDNLISLTDAAKTCKYSQEYLSLRARQGKLKAEKIGRNWLTKQEWLDEYLSRTHYKKLELKPKKKLKVSDRDCFVAPVATGAPRNDKKVARSSRRDSSLAAQNDKVGNKEDRRRVEVPENLPVGEVPEIKDRGFSFPYFAPSFRFAFAFAMVCVLLFTGTIFGKPAFLPMRDSLVSIKNSLRNFELRDTPIPVILSVAKDPVEMFRGNATGFFAPLRSTQNDIIGGLEDVSDFTRRGFAHINETFVSDVSQSKEDVKNMFRLARRFTGSAMSGLSEQLVQSIPSVPRIDFSLPDFDMPSIVMPTMPEFDLSLITDYSSSITDQLSLITDEIASVALRGSLAMTNVADDAYSQKTGVINHLSLITDNLSLSLITDQLSSITDYSSSITDQLSLVGMQAKKTFYAAPEITLCELLEPEIAMPDATGFFAPLRSAQNDIVMTFGDFEMPRIAMPDATGFFAPLRSAQNDIVMTFGDFEMPRFAMPEIEMPTIAMPQLPDFEIPSFEMPEIEMSSIVMPDFSNYLSSITDYSSLINNHLNDQLSLITDEIASVALRGSLAMTNVADDAYSQTANINNHLSLITKNATDQLSLITDKLSLINNHLDDHLSLITDYSLFITDQLSLVGIQAKKTFYAMPEITLCELLEPELTTPRFITRSVLVMSDSADDAYLYTAQVTAQVSAISTDTAGGYFSWLTGKTIDTAKSASETFVSTLKTVKENTIDIAAEKAATTLGKAGQVLKQEFSDITRLVMGPFQERKQKQELETQEEQQKIVQQVSEDVEKELIKEIERLEEQVSAETGGPAEQIVREVIKEVIREVEVSKITTVEPIKEITKQTIITKIDDEELEAIKIKLAEYDLWGKDIEELRKITKKLQSRPAAVASSSAPIYIASQGIQVGGHGNFDSIGASGAGTFGNLSVGGSTYFGSSANDRLTVVASSTFDSSVTINNTLTQTSGQVSFAGNVDTSAGLDVTGADFTVGGTNFVVDVATGNLIIAGDLTVVGAQTYSGAADFTANSAVSALSVNQQGAGNVVLFQNNGADAFVIAHSGQLTITSDAAPQLTLGYDATNFLTVGCDASSNITFTSLASLYHIYADTGEYQLQRGADVVFAINTNGSIDLTPIAGQIVSLAGPAQISEAALAIASKVAEDLLFRPMFDSRSLTGTRGQVATYTDDTDNIPIFNLVQDAAEMASGGRAYTTITGTDNESLSYPTAGNIDADDGTISLWYSPSYASTVAGDKYIFHTQDHLQIYYNGADDKFYCQAYNGTNYTTAEATSAAQTFAANDWLHILCAYDNNHGTETVKLYVNNVETTDTDTWTAQPLPANMFIGSDISANNQSYGKISDFTIFNRVLTRAEVQQIYYLKQPIQDYAHTTTPYANTATVGKYGADYTTISAALTALAGTSDQPALIQVMPGVYQEAITLEDYVDIIAIGGPEVTTIQQATSTIITAGADNCRLQGFTINKTTDDATTAISLLTYSPTLENLIITGAGVATQTAIDITSGSPQIENIRISNVNTAITTATGSPTIINAKIGETTQVATGVKHTGTSGTTTVRYSMISSTTDDIYAFGNGATIVSSNNILQSTTNNFETEIGATIESSFDNYNSTDSDGFLYDLSDTTVYTEANNDVDVGTAVYLSAANTVNLAKADSSTTMPAIGIVVKEDGTNVWVKSYGIYYEQGANYAVGESYYVSSGSAGAITATKPAGELAQVVGVAISSEELSLTSMSGEIENNSYQNVLTVSPDGGGYATIQAAIDVIVSPTSSNRWLVLVYPGVYDEAITLDEDYTDLIAIAGASVTKVTQADTTALTVTSNNNIIKGFNFDISAGTDGAVVVALNASPASVIFEDSTITWVGAGSATGIAITTGSPYIKRTTISQVAKAITITTGSPTITQSDLTSTDTGISIATGGGTIALTYNSVNATNDDIIAPSLSSATVINSSNNWLRSSNDNFDINTNATVNSYKDTYTTINTNSSAGTFNQKDYIRNDTVTALTVEQAGSGASAQFGDGTDYVQIDKSGNITFTNVDAGSTITGPGTSSFTIANTGEIILTSDSVETMRIGCPSGYILVPGSSTYSTQDFCVMKYEAKYDKTGDGDGDTEGDCYVDVLYDTWDWGKVGGDCPGSWTRDSVVSTANGSPIAGITQTQSIDDACPTGSHLITNDEWMTIARNAEQVATNWVGGVVGTGCFHRGNTGTGDPCGAAAYNGADPEAGTGRDTKAKLTLSNGEELWDLSGNVYEWTNNTATRGNQPQPAGWNEIAKDGNTYNAITSWTSQVSYADVGPLDTNLNDANGVGRIYSHYSSGSSDVRAFRRGGSWGNSADAGAFTLNLGGTPGGSSCGVGFRCVRDTISASTTSLTQISGSLRADDTTFVVDALNNRVGIGTATPTEQLHVAGQCVTSDTLLPIIRQQNNQLSLINNRAVEVKPQHQIRTNQAQELLRSNLNSQIEYVRIDEIKGGEMVLSLNEKTGKIEPARIKGLMDMGVKPVFKMTTEDGRFIRTTGNHPYLTEQGWTKIINLKAGDKIAVPRAEDLFDVVSSFDFHEIEEKNASQTENCSSEIKYSHCIDHNFSINNTPNTHKPIDAIMPKKNSAIFSGALSEIKNGITTEAKNICPKVTNIPETTFICSDDNTSSINYNDNTLEDSVNSDIQWQAIKSIEYVGQEQVWDIEVEGTHNFVAGHFVPDLSLRASEGRNPSERSNLFFGGIIAHNTYMAGLADVVQLTVRANATQTSDLVVFEQSDGTDVFTVDNAGNVDIAGAIDNGLVAWWPLDEGTGDAIADKSIKSNDAIKCPTGWVAVPGNSSYGSGADFCVMKYEAKYDEDGDGDGDTEGDCYADVLYDTWDWGKVGGDCPGSWSRDSVVSTANGSPIAGITQTQSIDDACPTGSHLITNNEWMTIARNAEQVAANWADNTIGSTVASNGGFFRGNVGITDTASYNAATDPEAGTGRNTKAKLTLSNGEELWDLSGNVWEWINDTASTTPVGGGWKEIEDVADDEWTADVPKSSVASAGGYTSAHGIGKIWTGARSDRAFLRGGGWGGTSNAGAFTLNLGSVPGNSVYGIGLRCVRD